jgi:hypothetical protein
MLDVKKKPVKFLTDENASAVIGFLSNCNFQNILAKALQRHAIAAGISNLKNNTKYPFFPLIISSTSSK